MGCSLINCTTIPEPTPCALVNPTTGLCIPSNSDDPEFDKPVSEMLGYICYSPQDIADIKKFIRNVTDDISNERILNKYFTPGKQPR